VAAMSKIDREVSDLVASFEDGHTFHLPQEVFLPGISRLPGVPRAIRGTGRGRSLPLPG
jgi:hypothetical protein